MPQSGVQIHLCGAAERKYMSTMVVFQQMLVIFILIAVGYGLCKKGKLSEETSRQLSGLVTNFCNPAIMLTGAIEAVGVPHESVLITAGIAGISYFVVIVLGFLVPGLLRVPRRERRFYNMMLVYGNTGFIGIPVVSAVLGSKAVIYVTVFNLFFNCLIYTHGAAVMSSGRDEGDRPSWTGIINVGTVCGILSFIIYWWGIQIPVVIADSISYMSRCVTFLSMLILGVSLAQIRLREVFTEKRLYVISVLKLLVIPVVLVLVMKQFIHNPLILGTASLIIAMPVGNMPLMMAKQMNLECEVLSKGIILTTLLSMLTIPAVAFFI